MLVCTVNTSQVQFFRIVTAFLPPPRQRPRSEGLEIGVVVSCWDALGQGGVIMVFCERSVALMWSSKVTISATHADSLTNLRENGNAVAINCSGCQKWKDLH